MLFNLIDTFDVIFIKNDSKNKTKYNNSFVVNIPIYKVIKKSIKYT